jgi:hypothetical protein
MTHRRLLYVGTALLLALTPAVRAYAQTKCLPGDIEKYAAKASSRSDINLDHNLLAFAGNFLNDKNSDDAQARQIMHGLNAIVVHSYEFDQPNAYNPADLESIRSQYQGAEWSHIVSNREQHKGQAPEYSDIWMHIVDGKSTGMVILSAEEKELSFVCIDGVLDPQKLSTLSGHFGIPSVDTPSGNASGNKKLLADDADGDKQ